MITIKDLHDVYHISHEYFAELVGLSQGTISRYSAKDKVRDERLQYRYSFKEETVKKIELGLRAVEECGIIFDPLPPAWDSFGMRETRLENQIKLGTLAKRYYELKESL